MSANDPDGEGIRTFLAGQEIASVVGTPRFGEGEDLADAMAVCEMAIGPDPPRGAHRLGAVWLQHAIVHLGDQLDAYLRAGHPPPPDSDEERGARKLLREATHGLTEGADALKRAAYALRDAGKAHEASVAHDAYRAAQATAEATALDPYGLSER